MATPLIAVMLYIFISISTSILVQVGLATVP